MDMAVWAFPRAKRRGAGCYADAPSRPPSQGPAARVSALHSIQLPITPIYKKADTDTGWSRPPCQAGQVDGSPSERRCRHTRCGGISVAGYSLRLARQLLEEH